MLKKSATLIIVLFIIAITGCSGDQNNQLQENQKKAVLRIMELFDGGNVDELDSIIAENAVEHQLDTTITKKTGREAVKDIFRYYHEIFPDMKTTVHSIAVSNDTVFVYSTSTGTASEPFMGIPAGQVYSVSGVDIMRFEGDKAVEHWGFIDFNEVTDMMNNSSMQDNSMMKNN